MSASAITTETVVVDVEEAIADKNVEVNENDSKEDDGDEPPTVPLIQSSRMKGYILLLVSASLNLSALYKLHSQKEEFLLKSDELGSINWCMVLDDISSFFDFVVMKKQTEDLVSLRYGIAAACMTVIISCFVVLCYFDFCTILRRKLWSKMFGPNKWVELIILSFLVILWLVTVWFNTTIRGIAGEGNEQYNIYFTSWLCLWTTFWTLERWFVASGKSSFEKFVRSWPNRTPAWICCFIFSFADFLFVLDAQRNWQVGALDTPYTYEMFSGVSYHEWAFFEACTISLFIWSLIWILAEIFRKNIGDDDAKKGDVENYIEGILLHIMAILWIVLILFTTMPGHSASLIGNLYFTTWGTSFCVILTLVWWLRDWRNEIADTISEQQAEYEHAKRAVLRREEKRLAKMIREENNIASQSADTGDSNNDEMIIEDEAREDIVDDDITVSIASVSGTRARTDTIDSSEGERAVCSSATSLFVQQQ